MRRSLFIGLLAAIVLLFAFEAPVRAQESLPLVIGPTEPRVAPTRGDDGLFHQDWFVQSFLELRDDHAEARSKGRRFAVIFEQRGCIYCTRMHSEVLSERYINDYVRQNFSVVQLDLWGSRQVTDFDGHKLSEKKLAERWGVMFTPTIVFFKEDIAGVAAKWGAPLEVARLPLGFGPLTFIDLFAWVRTKAYEKDPSFQRFHIARMAERNAPKTAAKAPRDKIN